MEQHLTQPNLTHSYNDLEFLAKLLDDQFEIAGFRFGLSFLIDLVPGIGDLVATAIALYVFNAALRFNISRWTMLRMLLNIAFYFLVGLIPLAGDVLAATFKLT